MAKKGESRPETTTYVDIAYDKDSIVNECEEINVLFTMLAELTSHVKNK